MLEEDIAIRLFHKYYESDSTPSALVSSYWKEMHQKAEVRLADGRLFLKGFAFGSMYQISWPCRFFSWATVISYLFHINNKFMVLRMMRPAMRVAARMGVSFTYDCFRQVCSLALIRVNGMFKTEDRISVLCIGDGFGFLSCLIKEVFPKARIVFVDLGKTLLFQAYFSKRAFPDCKHVIVSEATDASLIADNDFIYCAAENLRCLNKEVFDLAINIVSMQEMNQDTVKDYFEFMRKHLREDNLFYCCNRQEKIMPGGEVSKIMDYPWERRDRFLVDQRCPWHVYFLSHHVTERGLNILGLRIPFVNFFDGVIIHRLAVLKTMESLA